MKIEIPKNCPCCNYPLIFVKDQLFCKNTSCSAQLNKKLEHFTKVLGIKGLGPKTIEKLNLSDILEIFYLDREDVAIKLGSEKVADKLLDEVERAKVSDFATVLAAFSIPLIGTTIATKLASIISTFSEISEESCKQAGLGEKATTNLLDWMNTEYVELEEFLPFSFNSSKPIIVSAGTICITGKLSSYKNKAEASQELSTLGFKVVESVTKDLSYLVDEQNNGSSKRKKAESYGIPIINNLKTFMEEIKT